MIIEKGEVSFKDVDGVIIPCNIFIGRIDMSLLSEYDDLDKSMWEAHADMFSPETGLHKDHFWAFSSSREELVTFIQKHTIPRYEAALHRIYSLEDQDSLGISSFYYWT